LKVHVNNVVTAFHVTIFFCAVTGNVLTMVR